MADGLGGITGISIDTAQAYNALNVIGTVLVILFILIFIFLILRFILKHNIKTYLLFRVGEGIRIKQDKGHIDEKKKEYKCLRNRKLIAPYPQSHERFLQGKGEAVFGYVNNNVITWLTIKETPHFITADMNMMNWVVDLYSRVDEATKNKLSFWDKYGHQVIWMATIVIFLIAIILILQSVNQAISMGGAVMSKAMSTAEQQAIQKMAFIGLILFRRRK